MRLESTSILAALLLAAAGSAGAQTAPDPIAHNHEEGWIEIRVGGPSTESSDEDPSGPNAGDHIQPGPIQGPSVLSDPCMTLHITYLPLPPSVSFKDCDPLDPLPLPMGILSKVDASKLPIRAPALP